MRRVLAILSKNKILTLIIILASIVRFVGLIPNIAHPDELYIIKASRNLVYNIIQYGNFDPHAYKYGSVIFYLQSLVYLPIILAGSILLKVGFADPPPKTGAPLIDFIEEVISTFPRLVYLEGRAITALFGVGSVILVYFIAKKLFNKWVGLGSALFLAVSPFHVRDSHYITTDIPFLFFLLLALLFTIKLIEKSTWKWYLLTGLVIGLSSTIRYFPLALLPYPLALILSKNEKSKPIKSLLSLLMIPIGVSIGIPFAVFSESSRNQLLFDTQTQMQWYGTGITAFVLSAAQSLVSFGKKPLPDTALLLPVKFTKFYLHLLFFKALNPLLILMSLLGLATGLIKHTKKTLFLMLIPTASFIYTTFYISAVYERLILPLLPFAAILTSLFIYQFHTFLKNLKIRKKYLLTGAALILAAAPQIKSSLSASISCTTESAEMSMQETLKKKVPKTANIAQVSPVTIPASQKTRVKKEVRPDTEFSIEELQKLNIDHLFINTSIFTRFLYPFKNNFFIPPRELYENAYIPLVLREYESRATLIDMAERYPLCDGERFIYYKLPPVYSESGEPIYKEDFQENISKQWELEDFNQNSKSTITHNANDGHTGKGALEYKWLGVYYRGQRLVLKENFTVFPDQVYTLKAWVKSDSKIDPSQRDAFFRLDFFENKEEISLYPSRNIALTNRIVGEPKWQQVSVTVKTPIKAKYAQLSFDTLGTRENGVFLLDDIQLFGP